MSCYPTIVKYSDSVNPYEDDNIYLTEKEIFEGTVCLPVHKQSLISNCVCPVAVHNQTNQIPFNRHMQRHEFQIPTTPWTPPIMYMPPVQSEKSYSLNELVKMSTPEFKNPVTDKASSKLQSNYPILAYAPNGDILQRSDDNTNLKFSPRNNAFRYGNLKNLRFIHAHGAAQENPISFGDAVYLIHDILPIESKHTGMPLGIKYINYNAQTGATSSHNQSPLQTFQLKNYKNLTDPSIVSYNAQVLLALSGNSETTYMRYEAPNMRFNSSPSTATPIIIMPSN